MSKIIYKTIIPDTCFDKTVILDGSKIPNMKTLFDVMWDEFMFPDKEHKNWDAYLDWIRDLTWLKEKTIGIIVIHSDMFLKDEPNGLEEFIKDYEFPIIPYWDSIKEVDSENAKDITLCCIKSE